MTLKYFQYLYICSSKIKLYSIGSFSMDENEIDKPDEQSYQVLRFEYNLIYNLAYSGK